MVDGEVAAVGSFNLDPRSSHLNTEVMVLVRDEAFARLLADEIEADMHPRNSWVIWRRERPLLDRQVDDLLSYLSDKVASLTTLDLWPSQYASAFDLRHGEEPVPPGHPDFYDRYREVGDFPEVDPTERKLVLALLFKAVGTSADWLL